MDVCHVSFIRFFGVLVFIAIKCSWAADSPPCSTVLSKLSYDYKTEVKVGVEGPYPTSLFKLSGQLNIFRPLNYPCDSLEEHSFQISQLRNLKTSDINSSSDQENAEVYEDAPPATSVLREPFSVLYDNGKFVELISKNNDEEWSLNIKKALADAFQLPSHLFQNAKNEAFRKNENSIYGNCLTEYNLFKIDSGVGFSKVRFTNLCDDEQIVDNLDVENSLPNKGPNNMEDFNGITAYKVNLIKYKSPVIESIKISEKILNNVFGDSGEKKYIIVSQNITLNNVDTSFKKSKSANEENRNSIDRPSVSLYGANHTRTVTDLKHFQLPSNNPFGLVSITNGRGHSADENNLNMVKEKLKGVVDYLQENHLISESKEIYKKQVLYELLISLRYLNVEDIKKLYSSVFKPDPRTRNAVMTENLFFQMLPKIGSQASLRLVLDILNDDEIDEERRLFVVVEVPFYIMNYDVEVINILSNLTELTTKSDMVRYSATLAFSVVYAKYLNSVKHFDELFYSKIHQLFINKIADNHEKNYEISLLYVEALKNLNTSEALDYLEKIVSNKNFNASDGLRLRAMMGPSHPITRYPARLLKMCLPILTNTKEPGDLRVAALSLLMEYQFAQGDLSPFTLHWYMKNERNVQLYNYYYTLLKSYADSVNPVHSSKKLMAEKILRFSRKPAVNFWESSAWMLNYISTPYGYGSEFILRTFSDGKRGIPSMLYAEWNSIFNGVPKNNIGIHLKIKGLQDELMKYMFNNPVYPNHDSNKSSSKPLLEPVQVEAVVQLQGYTLAAIYLDKNKSFHVGFKVYDRITSSLNELLRQSVSYYMLTDRVLMTSIGIPVVINVHYPYVCSFIGSFDTNKNYSGSPDDMWYKLKLDSRISSTFATNLFAFNPIMNTWHGISKVHSYDYKFPIEANLGYSGTDSSTSYVFEKAGDGNIGMKMAAQTYSTKFSGNDIIPNNYEALEEIFPQIPYSSRFLQADVNKFLYKSNLHGLGYNYLAYCDYCPRNLTKSPSLIISGQEGYLAYVFQSSWAKLDIFQDFLMIMPKPGRQSFLVLFHPMSDDIGPELLLLKVKFPDVHYGNPPDGRYGFNLSAEIEFNENTKRNNKSEIISMNTFVNNSMDGREVNFGTEMFPKVPENTTDDSKIIFHYTMKYPPKLIDYLAVDIGNETIKKHLSFESCYENDCMSADLYIKEEISDEQKFMSLGADDVYIRCEYDKLKPEWKGPLVPRTSACYEAAVKYFYTHKISAELKVKNIPEEIKESIGCALNYLVSSDQNIIVLSSKNTSDETEIATDIGKTLNVIVTHGVQKPKMSVEIASSTHAYKFYNLAGYPSDLYNFHLDNMHFSKCYLFLQYTGLIKSCAVSSASIETADKAMLKHELSSDYETLAQIENSETYGVYAKKSSNGLVAKIVVEDKVFELNNNITTLNGEILENMEESIMKVDRFRLWSQNGQTVLVHYYLGIYITYSPVFITLDQPAIFFRGFVNGLCGNLNGDPSDDYAINALKDNSTLKI